MSLWLNSRVNGQLKESSLSRTEEEAHGKLLQALDLHKERGHREKECWDDRRLRPYWDLLGVNGEVVATYWLSTGDEGATGIVRDR